MIIIDYLTVSTGQKFGGHLAGRFWLRASHEVASDVSWGHLIRRLDWAVGSASKMAHSHDIGRRPQFLAK